MFIDFWNRLSAEIFSPKADSAEVEEQIRRARSALPHPVVWLLGKTQSGKTSIIRAMTGSSQTEIGNGFRPCTRTAKSYAYPSEEDCLLRFLDTRGLGEANYNPAEDIAYCQDQAHLLMVVVRAMDHALATTQDALTAIRKAKRDWPVIVVQTALHEGYARGDLHPQPYPFDAEPRPNSVSADLARSLKRQREELKNFSKRFVAVDFTLPEDDFEPEFYGLESLWSAIEMEMPMGLWAMLRNSPELHTKLGDIYFRTAWPRILAYAILAGAAGAVPLVGLPIVIVIQAKMFQAIASIYEQPLTPQMVSEFGAAIGTGFLVGLLGRSLVAWIPVVGTAVAAAYSAATTFALGMTWCWYLAEIKKGVTPSAAKVREFFAQEMKEGRRRYREYRKPPGNNSPGLTSS